jgi:hypothetical protein
MPFVSGARLQLKIQRNVEKVQLRATKLIQQIKHLSLIDRLKYFNLLTMLYRRLEGNMIMVFQLLTGICDSNLACHLVYPDSFVTRGHNLRLYKRHVHFDLRKYFLEIVLNRVERVCVIMSSLLTQLVYPRQDLISYGVIKRVFCTI